MKTSVQCNLVKDRIAVLSPLVAANRFVRSWFHLMHGSLNPRQSHTRHLDWFRCFCISPVCPAHRRTNHATCDICSNRPILITLVMTIRNCVFVDCTWQNVAIHGFRFQFVVIAMSLKAQRNVTIFIKWMSIYTENKSRSVSLEIFISQGKHFIVMLLL